VKTNRHITAILALLLGLALQSCVTTTTGGFNADASDAQALEDYLKLAVGYFDANDMNGAKRHVNSALAINSRSADAYNILALIQQREGDIALADSSFRRALSFDRNNSRARNNYAVYLFSQERYRDAFDQLQVVANDSNYEGRALAFENLGRSALALNRPNDAESAFQRALQLNANLYNSALELSQLRINTGDWAGARTLFLRYLTIREFLNIPYSSRSLWVGIQIETQFQNDETVALYAGMLRALFPSSAELQIYRSLADGN
jgi:type IV pilus assembly protein PilF